MSSSAPQALHCSADEWKEGHKRALALLRDLESVPVDETDREDDCREGRPQENVVYGHLLGIISTQNDGVLAAFSSVLTHYMGNVAGGTVPDVDDGPSPIAVELSHPIPMQVVRPSRARIATRPFGAEVSHV